MVGVGADADHVAPLRPGFRLTEVGADWRIVCRTCGRIWRLPRANRHGGTILRLLDHAQSHSTTREETE